MPQGIEPNAKAASGQADQGSFKTRPSHEFVFLVFGLSWPGTSMMRKFSLKSLLLSICLHLKHDEASLNNAVAARITVRMFRRSLYSPA